MLSTAGILKLHTAIREALEEDDNAPPGSKRFGVREFADWRVMGDELEAELDKRGDEYDKLRW